MPRLVLVLASLVVLDGCYASRSPHPNADAGVDSPTSPCDGSECACPSGLYPKNEECLPACPTPLAPVLTVIDDSETLTFTTDSTFTVEVATLDVDAPMTDATFIATTTLALASFSGATRILARLDDPTCAPVFMFDATYDVEPTYPAHPPEAGTTAIPMRDARFVGWATGLDEVTYGPGSALPMYMMATAALGPAQGSSPNVVSLGNGGHITLLFEPPITNGDAYDFAVFENAFSPVYLEVGFVEVSTDGETFVRFDSASRFAGPPCVACAANTSAVGGLGGAYMAGFGTPFDLEALANHPAVRSGAVDLHTIRYVRIVDIIGDGSTLDSFGRAIYDPLSAGPNAGFDLDAIGVIHARTN